MMRILTPFLLLCLSACAWVGALDDTEPTAPTAREIVGEPLHDAEGEYEPRRLLDAEDREPLAEPLAERGELTRERIDARAVPATASDARAKVVEASNPPSPAAIKAESPANERLDLLFELAVILVLAGGVSLLVRLLRRWPALLAAAAGAALVAWLG